MKTVIFYDTKNYEREYYEKELYQNFEIVFRENSLNLSNKLTYREENAEIISVFTGSVLDGTILKKFKNLKLLLTRSVGFSHIDIEYCDKRGIIVANTPHYGDYTVAEFSFGLLLNLLRRICFG